MNVGTIFSVHLEGEARTTQNRTLPCGQLHTEYKRSINSYHEIYQNEAMY